MANIVKIKTESGTLTEKEGIKKKEKEAIKKNRVGTLTEKEGIHKNDIAFAHARGIQVTEVLVHDVRC